MTKFNLLINVASIYPFLSIFTYSLSAIGSVFRIISNSSCPFGKIRIPSASTYLIGFPAQKAYGLMP